MTTRLLVFIDFSPSSVHLLQYSYLWADKLQADLLLVHHLIGMVPRMLDEQSRTSLNEIETNAAVEQLKTLRNQVLPAHAQVTYLVSSKPIGSLLKELLQQSYNQLIFAGVKGTGFIKKLFIGSTTIKLIEETTCPVIAIPPDLPLKLPSSLLVAVGDKYTLNVVALQKLLKNLASVNVLQFTHLAQSGEATDAVETVLADMSAVFSGRYATSWTIHRFDDDRKNNWQDLLHKTDEILVVQRGSRLLSDHFFRKFMINELVYDARVPLIVLP